MQNPTTEASLRSVRLVLATVLLGWAAAATFLALLPQPPAGPFGDDLGHFLASLMLGLGALTLFRWWRSPRLSSLLWILTAAFVGIAVELLQDRVGRSAEGSDFFADLAGVFAALVLSGFLVSRFGSFLHSSGERTLSARGHWLVTLVLSAGLLVALVGPVRGSEPVQNWWRCSGSRQPDASQAGVTLTSRQPDAEFIDSLGSTLTTDSTNSRNTIRDSSPLTANIRCSGTFTAMARVETSDLSQVGPTRIVASSIGVQYNEQNFHLGQEGLDLSVRIRTKPNQMESFLVEGVFVDSSNRHLTLRFSEGKADIFVDGVLWATINTADKVLDDWADLPISVGDEVTDDRAFIGNISEVEVTSTWLTDVQIAEASRS